jgi:hypothetical protein
MRKVGNLNEKTIDFNARRATTPATESAPVPPSAKPAEVRARN